MNSGFNILNKRKFNSFLDNVSTEIKLASFLILSILVFFTPTIYMLLGVLFFVLLFAIISKVSLKYYFNSAIIILLFAIPLFFLNYLVLFDWMGSLILTLEISLRVYILIFSSSFLILSSTEFEISNTINFLIGPLKYLKVPTREISLIISLGLRYVPILIFESRVIMEAQTSRGNDFKTGSIRTKIRASIHLFNPLIFSSFYKANETSNALYVRGYRLDQERTIYQQPKKITIVDFSTIVFFLSIFLLVAVMV